MKQTNMSLKGSFIGFAALLLPAGSATATTFFEEKFTCPVGGKRFSSPVMGSNSYFGQRPDGRPYSPMPVSPLIECPDNGFILYKEKFSREEIQRATAFVASAAYQAMRATETPHYRLWWLRRELGETAEALADALLVASWETDGNAPRKARYQAAFVDAVAALGPDTDARARFFLSLRAANALRELGRFDEASTMLNRIADNPAMPDDKEERAAILSLIEGLRALVAEKVTASEPVTLIPDAIAIYPCIIRRDSLAPIERTKCETPTMQQEIAQTSVTTEDGRELTGEAAIRYIARDMTEPGD